MSRNSLAIAYAAKRRAKYGSAKPAPTPVEAAAPEELNSELSEELPEEDFIDEPKKVNIAEIIQNIRKRK